MRLKREEQVGLLTCAVGHHSLLLDSQDYWGDVLQDGRPKQSRCRCGNTLFKVTLEYEFRDDGEVRTVLIKPTCTVCAREQSPAMVGIKYALTSGLISRPLNRIERPWFHPKRREITSFWKPVDAERFATYLVSTLGARVFSKVAAYEYKECNLENIQFYPELKCDLLFTNLQTIQPPPQQDAEKAAPFLRLTSPLHMGYGLERTSSELDSNIGLLHYIRYTEQVMRGIDLETQPETFLTFTRQAREWLAKNFVSLRGKNTMDNLQEHIRIDRLRFPAKTMIESA
jgi:hypothetical protein